MSQGPQIQTNMVANPQTSNLNRLTYLLGRVPTIDFDTTSRIRMASQLRLFTDTIQEAMNSSSILETYMNKTHLTSVYNSIQVNPWIISVNPEDLEDIREQLKDAKRILSTYTVKHQDSILHNKILNLPLIGNATANANVLAIIQENTEVTAHWADLVANSMLQVADITLTYKSRLAFERLRRAAIQTLEVAHEIDNILIGFCKRMMPPSFFKFGNDFIACNKARPDRVGVDPTIPTLDIPGVLRRPVEDLTRYATLLAEIQTTRGLVTIYQRTQFRNDLLSKPEYRFKSTEILQDYLTKIWYPYTKCLEGTDSALTNLDCLQALVYNLLDVPRFTTLKEEFANKMDIDPLFRGNISLELLMQVIKRYTSNDDLHWHRNTDKNTEVNSMLEINSANWKKNVNQKQKLAAQGGSQSSLTAKTGPRPVPPSVLCHWCGANHFVTNCPVKIAEKPQTEAGKDAKRATNKRLNEEKLSGIKTYKKDSNMVDNNDGMISLFSADTDLHDAITESDEVNSIEISSAAPTTPAMIRGVIPPDVVIDSGAAITTLSAKPSFLSNVKPSDQILSYANHSTSKVECTGDLGEMKNVVVNKDTKTLVSLPKLCTENKLPIVCDDRMMYLLKPSAKVQFRAADVLLKAPLKAGLYRANFNDLVAKVGKIDLTKK